jgi:hypothetical protein
MADPKLLDDDQLDVTPDQMPDAPATPAAPPSIKDIIAQRLSQQDSALKDAQSQQAKNMGMLGIAQAIGQAIGGVGSAFGGQGFNPGPYKALEASAGMPVQNLLQRQEAQNQGLGQIASQQKIEDSANAQDPNSPRAKMLQALIGRVNPKFQGTNFAPEDMNNVTKILDTEENAKSRAELAKQNAALRGMMFDDKIQGQYPAALQKNKSYTQADTTMNSADALIDTVGNATTNKTSAQALPTELANFASRGQRLHQATVEAFQNPNSDLMTRIKMSLSKGGSGVIPVDVANDIKSYLQLEKNAATLQRQSVMRQEAERFKSTHGSYPRSFDPMASVSASAPPPSSGWGSQQEARLQQLLKKQQSGTLDSKGE